VKAKKIYFKTKYSPVEMLLNPSNAELNPICHLPALLGGATIVVVSRLRVKCFRYMVYINLNCIVHQSMVKQGYIPENEV
jgi:hypothetical protein